MLATHELCETHNGFAIYLRRPGFEFTPVTLRKIASFLCKGPDGSIGVFAFSYSMLDFVDAVAFPEGELLAQAEAIIRAIIDQEAIEPSQERTYEFTGGAYREVDNPRWWIPVLNAR